MLAGWRRARRLPGYGAARRAWLADLRRDPTPNRIRRFGQALVLAAELPADIGHLHAHFLHTPASVARYAAMMRGLPLVGVGACQGHLDHSRTGRSATSSPRPRWAVTCTDDGPRSSRRAGARRRTRSRSSYHGLDLDRFPPPPPRVRRRTTAAIRRGRSSSCRSAAPSRRKAMTICWRRWRCCRPDLAWRFVHIGGGALGGPAEARGGAARARGPHRMARRAAAAGGARRLSRGRSVRARRQDRARTATATACRTC